MIPEVVEWLVNAGVKADVRADPASKSPVAATSERGDDEEPEVLDAQYLQCTYDRGEWMKLYVSDPKQPDEGFTIAGPSNDTEVDVLCRAYANAGAEKRQAMRASFEFVIVQKRKR